jgi:NAD(P)-dependent dehydrogenase (short-subunit alcohol dehydrogenase family)
MKTFKGRTAVITGAASGFGLETSRLAAREGMNIVMADVQQDALDKAAAEVEALGAKVLAFRLDVSKGAEVEALGAATVARFGVPHLVFNNAGVGSGGLMWEYTQKDWEWIVGVNLMGVAHGIRVFTPAMLELAKRDPAYEGHIVNTASMAGLVYMPNTGTYNATKAAVVAMSETLYQDLALVTDRVHCSVLCPYFVPTGIVHSERNRPADMSEDKPLTRAQLVARALAEKAVSSGKLTAAQIAQFVMDAVAAERFYIFSHPHALAAVQTRADDILQGRSPSDPFQERPHIGENLRKALRE